MDLKNIPFSDSKLFTLDIFDVKQIEKKIGIVSFESQIERTKNEELLGHWNFRGNFRKNGFVDDKTKYGLACFNKALDIDVNDVEVVVGMKKGEQAARFNGLNYMEANSNPLLGYAEFSIAVWFLIEQWTMDFPLISTFETNSKQKKEGFTIFCLNSKFYDKKNLYELNHEEASEKEFLFNNVLKVKDWNCKIITYSGGELKEYLNGICVNTVKMNREILSFGKKFVIGAIADDLDFQGLKGKIAQVKLFNYVVPPNQVNDLA
jgi:hypothetical protein